MLPSMVKGFLSICVTFSKFIWKRPCSLLSYLLIVSFLFMHFEAYARVISFNNPLVDAADEGDAMEVKRLLASGYSADEKGRFGTTALMRAAYRGHEDVVELLIGTGAYINRRDIGGETPLHLAARNGNLKIIKLLVDAGAEVDVQDKEKWTPLMRAAIGKKKGVVRYLVNAGADVSKTNNIDESALVHASIANVPEIVESIINSSSFVDVSKNQKRDAIKVASRKNNERVRNIISSTLPQLDESKLSEFNRGQGSRSQLSAIKEEMTERDIEKLPYSEHSVLKDKIEKEIKMLEEKIAKSDKDLIEPVAKPEFKYDNVNVRSGKTGFERDRRKLEEEFLASRKVGDNMPWVNPDTGEKNDFGIANYRETKKIAQKDIENIKGDIKESKERRSKRISAARKAKPDKPKISTLSSDIFDKSSSFQPVTSEAGVNSAFPVEVPGVLQDSYRSRYLLQLGAFPNEVMAFKNWENLKEENLDLLSDMNAKVVRSFLSNGNNTVYRLRAGSYGDKKQAQLVCDNLRYRDHECFVVESSDSGYDVADNNLSPDVPWDSEALKSYYKDITGSLNKYSLANLDPEAVQEKIKLSNNESKALSKTPSKKITIKPLKEGEAQTKIEYIPDEVLPWQEEDRIRGEIGEASKQRYSFDGRKQGRINRRKLAKLKSELNQNLVDPKFDPDDIEDEKEEAISQAISAKVKKARIDNGVNVSARERNRAKAPKSSEKISQEAKIDDSKKYKFSFSNLKSKVEERKEKRKTQDDMSLPWVDPANNIKVKEDYTLPAIGAGLSKPPVELQIPPTFDLPTRSKKVAQKPLPKVKQKLSEDLAQAKLDSDFGKVGKQIAHWDDKQLEKKPVQTVNKPIKKEKSLPKAKLGEEAQLPWHKEAVASKPAVQKLAVPKPAAVKPVAPKPIAMLGEEDKMPWHMEDVKPKSKPEPKPKPELKLKPKPEPKPVARLGEASSDLPWHKKESVPKDVKVGKPVSSIKEVASGQSTKKSELPVDIMPKKQIIAKGPIEMAKVSPVVSSVVPTKPKASSQKQASIAKAESEDKLAEIQKSEKLVQMDKQPIKIDKPSRFKQLLSNKPKYDANDVANAIAGRVDFDELDKKLDEEDVSNKAEIAEIQKEIRGIEHQAFMHQELSEIEKERNEQDYKEFYKQLEQNPEQIKKSLSEAPVSEAILVPNEAYFDNKSNVSNAPLPWTNVARSGIYATISGFSAVTKANDYWSRMFKYDTNYSNLQSELIPDGFGNDKIALKIGPLKESISQDICDLAKKSGHDCLISGQSNISEAKEDQAAEVTAEDLEKEYKEYRKNQNKLSTAGEFWINLGNFNDQSQGEYYWMYLLEDNEDILGDVNFNMIKSKESSLGEDAVQIKLGPFAEGYRASQICNILKYRNVACLVMDGK